MSRNLYINLCWLLLADMPFGNKSEYKLVALQTKFIVHGHEMGQAYYNSIMEF